MTLYNKQLKELFNKNQEYHAKMKIREHDNSDKWYRFWLEDRVMYLQGKINEFTDGEEEK